jgi:hypothetical protein
MKKEIIKILFVFIGLCSAGTVDAQTPSNKLIDKNVVKTANSLTVKHFKNVDLSSYATPIDTLKMKDAILNNVVPVERVFTCTNPEGTKPLTFGGLNQLDQRVFDVTKTAGVDLSLWGITGSLGRNVRLIQASFWAFKDVYCDPKSVRALVGFTLYIKTKNFKVDIGNMKIDKLIATIKTNNVQSTFNMSVYGLTESVDMSQFDLSDDLAKSADGFLKVIANLKKDLKTNLKVDPVIIPNIIPSVGNFSAMTK